MATVKVNGTELNYEIQGTGPPFVLVHGSWSDVTSWMLAVPLLAETFTVVTYDRRGHGGSAGAPDEGTRVDDEADLAGLIEALDIAPANVAGNSFGASTVLGSAGRHPEAFRRIAGHEPPLLRLLEGRDDGVLAEQRDGMARVLKHLEAGEYAAGAELFVEEVALGRGAWAQLPDFVQERFIRYAPNSLGEQRDPNWDAIDFDALAAYPGRVLLTQGGASLPWFAKVIDEIEQNVPKLERRTIADAGHVPQMTHPNELAEMLRSYFTN